MSQNIKIITAGWLSEQFYEWVQQYHPEIDIELAKDHEDLKSRIADFNVFAGFHELHDCDLSSIDWIHSFGAGVDAFLANPEIQKQQIPISRTTGELGRKIGEYCLGHVLNRFQNIPRYDSAQQNRQWKPKRPIQLKASQLLILGTGSVGKGIANCFTDLVQKTIGVNTNGLTNAPFDFCINFDSSFPAADIIINALPKTSTTDHMLNLDFFASFKDAVFINVGRGSTVINDDLAIALEKGYLSYAILDVFDNEPLPKTSKLWKHPKISITPHVSGLTTLDDIIPSFEAALDQFTSEKSDAFINFKNGY